MKLYNTLTRKTDEIVPLAAPKVTIYTCGPTVYDYAHIGHWFNYVRMDMLVRATRAAGFEPEWVMNITDVGHLVSDADEGEDKLEKGARREGKTAWEVAEFYMRDFLEGMQLLNIEAPDHIVKATDHIAEQIALIQTLEQKGFTYVIDDGVYYDTSKFEGYAEFARLDLDEQQAGARVAFNTQKRNVSDFALWKFSPKDAKRDMEWDSPWGKGFPGWHIECSAMSMKYLGETLDVHAGGIDHIQVHHTNEIAQSEAATGKRFANYWMHSNHVMVNGEKISKSLGNGIRLQEIAGKGISMSAVRLHILESHYRSQSKFSWESLEAAQNRLEHWQAIADLRWQVMQAPDFISEDEWPKSQEAFDELEAEHPHTIESARLLKEVQAALQDDLDTPKTFSLIDEFLNLIEHDGMTAFLMPSFTKLLQFIQRTLGIDLFSEDINDSQKKLLGEREEARKSKDWTKSDDLRNKLEVEGIALNDTPRGATWRHIPMMKRQ